MSPGPKSDIICTAEYIFPRVQQSVCFFVGIGPSPHPLSRKRVCPPQTKEGGNTLASGEGIGDSHFGRKEQSLAVCLPCDMHRYAMCIRDLQCSKLDGIQTKNDRYLQINRILLLQNVWKYSLFEHKHSKCAKSANAVWTKKIVATHFIIRQRGILSWFQINLFGLKIIFRKKMF